MAKILVFGDSIAYGKWDEGGGWVQRLRSHIDVKYNVTHNKNIQVYNLSIPGEITTRLCTRIRGEMDMRIPLADTKDNNLVIIAVGINDTNAQNWISGKQTPLTDFKQNLNQLISLTSNKYSRCVVMGLTPIHEPTYEERFQGRLFNKVIQEYDVVISEVAAERNVPFVDMFEVLKSKGYEETLIDGIHPNSEGHKMISEFVIEFFQKNELFSYIER